MIKEQLKLHIKYLYIYFFILWSLTYWYFPSHVIIAAEVVTTFFTNTLKLVSLPIIFLSIVATFAKMEGFIVIRNLFRHVFTYTILTTLIASFVALFVFLALDPAQTFRHRQLPTIKTNQQVSYLKHLLELFPSNMIQPFYENNVIGVLILAFFIGTSILFLPEENKKVLEPFFVSLYATIINIVHAIVRTLPFIAVAFVILLISQLNSNLNYYDISRYLLALLIANFTQAFIVLPIFLLKNHLSPFKVFKSVQPALMTAFLSKSSVAAMPLAIQCAEKKLEVSKYISRISFPLCTTINMNACAAFILITVLFVSQVENVDFNSMELVGWVLISTIAAIGNAGIPMGCYFLTLSLLSSMGIPVVLLGVILPFYLLLDMIESAINLWSDTCVTLIVDRKFKIKNIDLPSAPSIQSVF